MMTDPALEDEWIAWSLVIGGIDAPEAALGQQEPSPVPPLPPTPPPDVTPPVIAPTLPPEPEDQPVGLPPELEPSSPPGPLGSRPAKAQSSLRPLQKLALAEPHVERLPSNGHARSGLVARSMA